MSDDTDSIRMMRAIAGGPDTLMGLLVRSYDEEQQRLDCSQREPAQVGEPGEPVAAALVIVRDDGWDLFTANMVDDELRLGRRDPPALADGVSAESDTTTGEMAITMPESRCVTIHKTFRTYILSLDEAEALAAELLEKIAKARR